MAWLLSAAGRWRILLSGILFLFSLLAVFRAPAYVLWLLAIVATEYGHFLALLCLLPLLPGWERSNSGRFAAILACLSFLLFLSPLLRSYLVAAELPGRLQAAFGGAEPASRQGAPARPTPIAFGDLLFGVGASPVTRVTVAYASPAGAPLEMDLYRPEDGRASHPVVVTIHGGSWRSGDKRDLPALNRYLAAHGYLVASPQYRLAPAAQFPAQLDDVRAAIAYLKAHAAELGADKNEFVLLGRSAGAQLALMAAYTPKDPAVRGAISFYGPTDMVFSYVLPSNPWVLDSEPLLRDYMGGAPDKLPKLYELASPLGFVDDQTPPTLMIHGTRDELVWYVQSKRLDTALAAHNRPHLFLSLPWATHGCDANFSGPCGQLSTYAVERFLAAVTHQSR